MSLRFVCRCCGWTESKHLYRKADASSVELKQRQVLIPGYTYTLAKCVEYTPGRAERRKIAEISAVLERHEEEVTA